MNTLVALHQHLLGAGATPAGLTTFLSNLRAILAPVYGIIVSGVAVTFLVKRRMRALIEFLVIASVVGALLFVPGIVATFGTWIAEATGQASTTAPSVV